MPIKPRQESRLRERRPLAHDGRWSIVKMHAPLPVGDPTHAIYRPQYAPVTSGSTSPSSNRNRRSHIQNQSQSQSQSQSDMQSQGANPIQVERLWKSRDQRKGRHALRVSHPAGTVVPAGIPPSTQSVRGVGRGLVRMCTQYPFYDLSFLIAWLFTWGSVIWCVNGFFAWLPDLRPQWTFKGEVLDAGGITAVVGAVVFEIGAALGLLEVFNAGSSASFGWALELLVQPVHQHRQGDFSPAAEVHDTNDSPFCLVRASPDMDADVRPCYWKRKARPQPQSLSQSPEETPAPTVGAPTSDEKLVDGSNPGSVSGRTSASASPLQPVPPPEQFQWWPGWGAIRSRYCHEIGFWANVLQLVGATLYLMSGIVGCPGIINHLDERTQNGVYFLSQTVGGSFFMLSSTLMMLETQTHWWRPSLAVLGWHIAFWNLVGGTGFMLCGALGFGAYRNTAIAYESTLSTFWASWAFLIGSVLQLYESLNKYPVSHQKS